MSDQAHKDSSLEARYSLGAAPLALLCLLSLIGLWVSDTLVLEHISLKLGDEADSGVCGASTLFSCKEAAKSAYGSILGLPIAAIGEAFYLTTLLSLITIKISSLRGSLGAPGAWGVRLLSALMGASALSVLYSLFLGSVSVLSLGLVCPLCVSLYGVNIASGALLWTRCQPAEGGSRLASWSGQWRGLWRSASPWLLTLLMGASLTVTQGAYATRWQSGVKALKRAQFKKPVQLEVSSKGPTRGESSAAQVVEFSDFQCPFCRRFSLQLKAAAEQLNVEGGAHRFQYTFKHYPLSDACNPVVKHNMHPRACHAAAASICAEEQGRFWEMHDLLFDHQNALEDEDLARYAQELKLDMKAFVDCLPSDRVKARILSDIREGRKAKLKGTPAFYINGWRFSGAVGVKKVIKLIKRYAYGVIEEGEE